MLSSPGKYSSDISPAFLLNVPYVLIPIWAGVKLFQQPRALPCLTAEQVSRKGAGTGGQRLWGSGAQPVVFFTHPPQVAEEQRKWLHQRPQDVVLVLLLVLAAAFTFFRGMVSAGRLQGGSHGCRGEDGVGASTRRSPASQLCPRR